MIWMWDWYASSFLAATSRSISDSVHLFVNMSVPLIFLLCFFGSRKHKRVLRWYECEAGMHIHFLGKVVLIFWVRLSSFWGSGHSLDLMIKEIFIILVNTRTLLENSTFHVLKYNKVSKILKYLQNFTFLSGILDYHLWHRSPDFWLSVSIF